MTKPIIAALSLLVMSQPNLALAETFSNDNYSIDSGKASGPLDFEELKLQKEKEAKQPQKAEKTNTILGRNFTYSYGFVPGKAEALSFSLSQDLIDLGILSATNPVIRNETFRITSPAGYQLFVYADHPLEAKSGSIIPDTTCDNGSCSEITAAPWENTLTYGYGYRCDGKQCDPQFGEKNYFKQFPNQENKEPMQLVISSDSIAKDESAKVTYKTIISGTQATSFYTNTVTYLTVPNY